jgi:cell division protein FtsW (lipid II flippase)
MADTTLTGEQQCRQFADGTREEPSLFCWIWFALLTVGFVSTTIRSVAQFRNESQKTKYAIVSVLSVVVGVLILYIFFSHCQRCNAWIGFFITLFLSVVSHMIFGAILPDQSS